VSSPSNPPFECRWRPSRALFTLYLAVLALAIGNLLVLPAPAWLKSLGLAGCMLHAAWVLPQRILLLGDRAWRGLRHDENGWQLWNRRDGWQPVQLRPDSMALPLAVMLRFRQPGQWFARGLCLPRDTMPAEQHRRLRLRLKFSRRRWAAAG
jgi:toxin CptA